MVKITQSKTYRLGSLRRSEKKSVQVWNLKGIVQRKVRWVESGVNQWLVLYCCGAGHFFLILKEHHLGFCKKRFHLCVYMYKFAATISNCWFFLGSHPFSNCAICTMPSKYTVVHIKTLIPIFSIPGIDVRLCAVWWWLKIKNLNLILHFNIIKFV